MSPQSTAVDNDPSMSSNPPTNRRWLRRVLWIGLAVPCLLWLSLHNSWIRSLWIPHLSDLITDRSGSQVDLGDIRLHLLSSELWVDDVAVRRAAGDVPLLEVDGVHVDWSWGALLASRRVDVVEIFAPRVDLEAPLPSPRQADDETDAAQDPSASATTNELDLGIDITSIQLRDGSVVQRFPEARGWLAAWQLTSLAGEGAYLDGTLTFEGQGFRLQPELAASADLADAVEAELAQPISIDVGLQGRLPATFQLDHLQARADGLHLEATGQVDVPRDVLTADFDLRADLPKLLPGVVDDAETVQASGQLDLKQLEGQVHVDAPRLPSRLFEPWIDAEIYRQWIPEASFVTAQADVQLDGPSAEGIRGEAKLGWHLPQERLATAEIRTLDLPAATAEPQRLRLDLDVQLLPDIGDTLTANGQLSAEDWQQLTQARIEAAQGKFELVDILTFQAELAQRWPQVPFFQGPTAEDDGDGMPLKLEWEADGPLQDPRVAFQLTAWDDIVTGQGQGRPIQQRGQVELDVRSLDLKALAPWLPETPQGRLTVDLQADLKEASWSLTSQGRGDAVQWPNVAEVQGLQWDTRAEGTRQQLRSAENGLQKTGPTSAWHLSEARVDVGFDAAQWTMGDVEGSGQDWRTLLKLEQDSGEPNTGEPGSGAWQLQTETAGRALEIPGEASPIFLDGFQLSLDGEGQLPDSLWRPGLGAWLADDLDLDPATLIPQILQSLQLETDLDQLIFDAEQPPVDGLHVSLSADRGAWRLDQAKASWNDLLMSADGTATWQDRLQDVRLEAQLQSPSKRLEALRAVATLDAGHIQLTVDDIASDLGDGYLEAKIPLANLGRIEGLRPALAHLPIDTVGGPIQISVDVPSIDSPAWLEFLQQPEAPWELQFGGQADLRIDLSQPQRSDGTVTVQHLLFHNQGQLVQSLDDLVVRWTGDRLELVPSQMRIGKSTSQLQGWAGLDWTMPEDEGLVPIPQLTDLQGSMEGDADLSFLIPYLPPEVRAEGHVAVQAQLSGNVESPQVDISVDGPEGRFRMVTPYGVQVTHPKADLRWRGDTAYFDRLEANVNGGQVVADGIFDPEGTLQLQGVLDAIRMRVDYGVIALLSGNFDLNWPTAEGPETPRPSVRSNLLVERAILRHNIDLDGLLLSNLLAAPDIVGLEGGDEDDIDLDLSIATIDGLRVRNNLADLRATWNPLRVRGTLSNPLIQGDIDAEPGGLVSVYGQTLRLDRAQITFPGVPGVAPVLDLATTSSLEDPSILSGREDVFAGQPSTSEQSVENRLASGLATYYGNQLASRLGRGLGSRTRLSVQPVLLFGESDPEARLALTRDISTNLALIAAVSLQDTQRRTYVLDVHSLPFVPAFVGQAFTNEEGQAGVTLQYSWEPGKNRSEDADATPLRRIDLKGPDYLPLKELRRVVERAVGSEVDDNADFDVEIDLEEALQREGYNTAQVDVGLVFHDEGADLTAVIDPGMRTEVTFQGLQPPKDQRLSISRLYRPQTSDSAPFDEMRLRTRQVLQAQGYPDPVIEIAERTVDGDDGRPLQLITIESSSEKRLPLNTPRFEGCDDIVETILQQRFTSKLQRMELVLESDAAKEQTEATLRGLGFAEPQWIDSRYDEDIKAPRVTVEPGPRRTIASFQAQGLDPGIISGEVPESLRAGAPLRLDLLSQAALALESRLRNEGYSDARVVPSVEPLADDALAYNVLLDVQRGPAHRLQDIEVSGQEHTREGWLRRIAGLPRDEVLTEEDITLARRRLLATGIVQRAQITRQPAPIEDTELAEADERPTDVVIDVQERPKYRIATGIRWESSEGVSAVFDVVDRSFTRRGSSLGLRALVGEDESSLRLYSSIPRILGSLNNLELFVEQRWDDSFELDRRRIEGSFQLSRRLTTKHLVRVYGVYREGEGLQVQNTSGDLEDFQNPFLGLQWIYGEQQPDKLFPDGSFASVDFTGSTTALGSDQDFVRLFSIWQTFRQPTKRRWLWGQSVRFGWADAFGEPLLDDLRFRTGGEFSVRGYSTDSLGSRIQVDDTLVPVGGEALLVLNQEVRFPVWDALAGLVFLDVGNVWSDKDDLGSDLATALGIGLRYDSPVGPLRLDVGFPLDRREGDSELKVYFGFGNIF